ncbi:sigma-70 family RNA polymerase sigma factor [Mucilaginibacter sp. HMF5004]|uniref:RNA polymerase sigma factor n=1 Tax=Mucilaginibacter rivuli TaxID=2857527 RepID=UPI001C5E49D5|nr:sigma-70 family RNA polymerase sigma factor [Mucilaginibacter rivuli]MBW4888448.1 sigma-70 family RNA polymerase sigma factor [Mucilaginibacter rivuli]
MEDTIMLTEAALEREELFISLYKKVFPAAAKYIARRGGSFDDAKDIFQDAVAVYYQMACASNDGIHSTSQAYIMGIVKHLWNKKYRENSRQSPLDEHTDGLSGEQEQTLLYGKITTLIETSGGKCMELLKAFYYDHLPLQKLTKTFGYSSERSATVQKYKCLEKLRTEVKQKHLSYADFIE